MTKEEILFLRSMLLDRRSDVIERVRKMVAAWQDMEERAIELEEEAQKASIVSPYSQLDETGKLEIDQIDLALTKMVIGDYGICESCGDDIAPPRLKAIPWARLCVDCAREYERKKQTLPRTSELIGTAKLPDEYKDLSYDQITRIVTERLGSDSRIDSSEIQVSVRRGVIYLDGSVPGEIEHQLVMGILADQLGFSSIVDRLEIGELTLEKTDAEATSDGNIDDRLFYDQEEVPEDMFESGARPPFCPPHSGCTDQIAFI